MDAVLFILFALFLLIASSLIAVKAWFVNKQYEAEKAASSGDSAAP